MTLLSADFYATASDLALVLAAVEYAADLDFVTCGTFETMPLAQVHPCVRSKADRYLVVDNGHRIVSRRVPVGPARRTRCAVERVDNPGSIEFAPGGANKSGDLIAGRIAYGRHDKAAERLSRVFARAIESHFTLIEGVRVGPQAGGLLDRGTRLRQTAESMPATDLHRQPQPVLVQARRRSAAIALPHASLSHAS